MAYQVGDRVWYWRNRAQAGKQPGRFVGPARVVVVEPSSTGNGVGSRIWITAGNRLLLVARQLLPLAAAGDTAYYRLLAMGDGLTPDTPGGLGLL